jgi:hypothetical protein
MFYLAYSLADNVGQPGFIHIDIVFGGSVFLLFSNVFRQCNISEVAAYTEQKAR